jgi:asparagine N-glycosylation enzyme membrane subunit Stt3
MIKDILITILVLIIVLYIGFVVSVNYYQAWNENCNIKYGYDNWIVKEITGTGRCRFYIGQCWECVSK